MTILSLSGEKTPTNIPDVDSLTPLFTGYTSLLLLRWILKFSYKWKPAISIKPTKIQTANLSCNAFCYILDPCSKLKATTKS